MKTKIVKDSMGELHIPYDALYGAQTQRAMNNFNISELRFQNQFIDALSYIKEACAEANYNLDMIPLEYKQAIKFSCENIRASEKVKDFPVDVFQTGSGTSTNMNMNEVIASLCRRHFAIELSANDHVNMSQSSNDVIPTCIHVASCLAVKNQLLPSLEHLVATINDKSNEVGHIIKTGKTHLMDATPISFGQELGGWAAQIETSIARVSDTLVRLSVLAQGGTAVGTGINVAADFSHQFILSLSNLVNYDFSKASNHFELISSQDTAVELSGQLKALAVSLMKISNDLRLMNSGPLTGYSEIELQALQPGSSIMPGKVNPVIPEAVMMSCAQVMGNDTTITIAGQSGNFQLNVMLPVIAYNLLQSILLLSASATSLADKAISSFKVKESVITASLEQNPMLATALNPIIGYMKASEIVKVAYASKRPILDVACDMTALSRTELEDILDPKNAI